MPKIRVTLVKSPIGQQQDQRDTVKRLGLHKMQSAIEADDTPSIRGMLHKVRHLVRVDEL